jgi:hypothetical protein
MEMTGLWIPVSIIKEPSLTAVEKFVLADVLAMVGGGLPYFKSNARIGLDFNVSAGTISRSVSNLIATGHLELVSFDGRKREVTVNPAYLKPGTQSNQKWVGRVNETEKPASSKAQHNTTVSKQSSKQLNIWWHPEYVRLTDAWEEWVDEQKTIRKKPYTQRAKQMALKRLNELSKGDAIQAINIINHAILKSWDTFWALPKNHTNNDKGFKKDNFTTDGLSDFIKNG